MAERLPVQIVGGGLVGSLLAVMLRRRGETVALYESRPDPRDAQGAAGRSINLIVTARGIHALRSVGLWAAVEAITVPVFGRTMHDLESKQQFQPYGKDDGERNYSVSRGGLNRYLLDAAEAAGVQMHFSHRLSRFDYEANCLTFESGDGAVVEVAGGVVFGADGAGSRLRREWMRREGAEESVEMLPQGYKEVEFPPAEGDRFRMDPKALHIWPRGEFMLMALPNPDGSFTGTLYMPFTGESSFEQMSDWESLKCWFDREFPDARQALPDLQSEFFENPTGELGTVRCYPWTDGERLALIGDASHAIVPFFGQGMNSGFEDCTILEELLDEHENDWSTVLPAYQAERKPNTDAIADLALDNFVEMRSRVGDARFLVFDGRLQPNPVCDLSTGGTHSGAATRALVRPRHRGGRPRPRAGDGRGSCRADTVSGAARRPARLLI
jgi:kynurenine 3-monooxygenase